MAVDSPHLNLCSPQILSNCRDMNEEGNNNVYGNGMKFGMMENEMVNNPMYVSSMMMRMMDVIPPSADSGLTCSFPVSRKRSHDTSSVLSFQNGQVVNYNDQINNVQNETFAFLGHDVSMQMYQQQVEVDRFIANHMEKVRLQIEATRRRNSMRLIVAFEEGIKKKLRSKEEEIAKIGKLNYALEEKVKSLNIESQIWQQMAQTNEATANVLRRNLEQTLTQIQHQQQLQQFRYNEDVESCCGSNYEELQNTHDQQSKQILVVNNDDDDQEDINYTKKKDNNDNNNGNSNRWCRNCGKRELSVLLLPCRHLCICTLCESSINFCPICKSTKNASLHVNMS
uniref:probable BOI-related E3 ubiquitin-protein ligase 3 n=1 Tax=Erigeron canadensis TaxID=72917 RepID=UPI001CB9B4F3|nr:probable BOI-related E3 ubiquitin-protein ligase 3 [Erigeron canadensis]